MVNGLRVIVAQEGLGRADEPIVAEGGRATVRSERMRVTRQSVKGTALDLNVVGVLDPDAAVSEDAVADPPRPDGGGKEAPDVIDLVTVPEDAAIDMQL